MIAIINDVVSDGNLSSLPTVVFPTAVNTSTDFVSSIQALQAQKATIQSGTINFVNTQNRLVYDEMNWKSLVFSDWQSNKDHEVDKISFDYEDMESIDYSDDENDYDNKIFVVRKFLKFFSIINFNSNLK